MNPSDFHCAFLQQMAFALYAFEVNQPLNPELLTNREIAEFCFAYCAYPK